MVVWESVESVISGLFLIGFGVFLYVHYRYRMGLNTEAMKWVVILSSLSIGLGILMLL